MPVLIRDREAGEVAQISALGLRDSPRRAGGLGSRFDTTQAAACNTLHVAVRGDIMHRIVRAWLVLEALSSFETCPV